MNFVTLDCIRLPSSFTRRMDGLVEKMKDSSPLEKPSRAAVRRRALEEGLKQMEACLSDAAGVCPVGPEAMGRKGRPKAGEGTMVRSEPFSVPETVAARLKSVHVRVAARWPKITITKSAVQREALARGLTKLEAEAS